MSYFSQMYRNLPPVTKNLILINLLVYAIQLIAPAQREAWIEQHLALHYFISPDFNPAQLVTYMFLHGGFTHVLFNMFALFMFGPQIEYSLGPKRFLFYYLSCGIGAALIQLGVYAVMIDKYMGMFSPDQMRDILEQGSQALRRGMNFTDPTLANFNVLVNGSVVGASGAVYGILLAFGMLFPNMTIYLLIPPMPIKAKWMVLGYGVLELLLGIGGPADGVAHFAHVGGMLVGFLIILYWKKKGTFNGYY